VKKLDIRPIAVTDNKILAEIIRNALVEFNAAKPGTVYFDKETDHLYDSFILPNSKYFVALINGEVVGGAGIYPTANLPKDTCELVKLYLHKNARGKGIGKMLMLKCEEAAKAIGFSKIYLETMPELNIAVPLYEKMGYKYLGAALGNSGHCGCNIWMLKNLK
jgi:putative acetyltransferase